MNPETKPRNVFTNRNYQLVFFGTRVSDLGAVLLLPSAEAHIVILFIAGILGLCNSAYAATIKTSRKVVSE